MAEEAVQQRQREHGEPDIPGQVARLAERAGEENAHEVQDDHYDDEVGRPVVRLA
jgi:hypothetical protein